MLVKELVERFDLTVAGGRSGLEKPALNGYCGDLLSDVMGKAPEGSVWMTVQGHQNIIAVAVLREMAAIVLVGGHQPDADTIAKADAEGIPILLWPGSAFALAGQIHAAGIGAESPA